MIKKSVNSAKKLIIWNLVLFVLCSFLAPINTALAVEPLTISNITVTKTAQNATITWQTNRPAYGKLEYGFASNNYHWSLQTNSKQDHQAMTIFGLSPQTQYYFRISAEDQFSAVASFEQTLTTAKITDNVAPAITKVTVAYLTGTTATIQWLTDEPATSEVEYGRTATLNSTKSDGKLVKVHDLTITGLLDGTYYHFRVRSKDANNNVAQWYDMTFTTQLGTKAENDALLIYSVTPSSENDINVTADTAVITWRTNKLAGGQVNYGTSQSYNHTACTNPPRDFLQSVTLTGLAPATIYYFEIKARDVFGREVASGGHTFTTKSNNSAASVNPSSGQVLAVSYYETSYQISGACAADPSMGIDLSKHVGYFGLYYNLPGNHPDTELPAGSAWTKVGRQNNWYNAEYFAFSRIDSQLNFGDNFFPIAGKLAGDPNHFAVNWRAIMIVPETGSYTYGLTSDDDAWLLIDDQLVSDLGGLHPSKTENRTVQLTAGYHKLEIFYADRRHYGATFRFIPDSRLKFNPLPDGCSIQDIINYTSGYAFNSNSNNTSATGQILGVSSSDQSNFNDSNSIYLTGPNPKYALMKALYKTADSPDVWAILVNNQRLYITSPASFNEYGLNWKKIKTVSKKTLESHPVAKLVKLPDGEDAAVYYLHQRAEKRWLKLLLPSGTVFISYPDNYWGNIARINHLDFAQYPVAALIRIQSQSTIYNISGNSKRPYASDAAFRNAGNNWADICPVNQIHADSYLDGAAIN